jgi:hypothetical protein
VDLDEPVAPPAVRPRHGEERPDEERGVLGEVHRERRALVSLDVEVVDRDAVDGRLRRVAGLAKGEDVDGPAGRDE